VTISNTSGGVAGVGSFANVADGATSTVSSSNFLASTYVNPYAMGLSVGTGTGTAGGGSGRGGGGGAGGGGTLTPFGQAVYTNVMSGSGAGGGTSGGLSSLGATGGAGGRSGSASGFGNSGLGAGGIGATTATGGRGGTAGGAGGVGGVGVGGAGGFGGTATNRGGAGGVLSFGSVDLGPSIGRTGPVVPTRLGFEPPVIAPDVRRADLQALVSRSPALRTPAGVNVTMDRGTVVLRGQVASADERRIVENMLRLAPGVNDLRNELQVQTGRQ
jgi:hypothetical protein